MPGVTLAEFLNPLRPEAVSGVPVVDVFRDIILPELASSLDEPGGLVDRTELDAVRQRGDRFFLDTEAEFIRRQLRDVPDSQPTHPFPGGGSLPDVTWAFNQATGARPEQDELDNESAPNWRRQDGATTYIVDPLTGRPIFPINANLPSLNRQPGIILVPIGLFPILGTIRLYGGQQLVGISAGADGSCLVKYGDGACIQTRVAADVLDEPWLSTEAATRRVGFSVDDVPLEQHLEHLRVRALLDRIEPLLARPADVPPPAWEPDDTKRRLILERALLTGEVRGFASVHIAGLHVRQLDWVGPRPEFSLLARPPFIDELGELNESAGFSRNTGGLRPDAVQCSSVGIDLLGVGLTTVEDCQVVGFRHGVGIRSRPRAYGGQAQVAYYNQIRHCRVSDCFVGIGIFSLLSFGFRDDDGVITDVTPREAHRLGVARADANSTVLFGCTVTWNPGAAAQAPRAGVEIWSGSTWLYFCRIEVSAASRGPTPGPCVLSAGGNSAFYRCHLRGRRHILTATNNPITQDGDLEVARRQTGTRGNQLEYCFYCRFLDAGGQDVQPNLHVLEFPIRPQDARPGIPSRAAERADASQQSFAPTWSAELPGPVFTPQSYWTSHNLLKNAGFNEAAGPTPHLPEWSWQAPSDKAITRATKIRVRTHDEPAYVGLVVEVELDLAALPEFPTSPPFIPVGAAFHRLRLYQELVPPIESLAASPDDFRRAWMARSVVRGSRLVASARAWANYAGAVGVGIIPGRATNNLPVTQFHWKAMEWLRVSSWLNVQDFDYPDVGGQEPRIHDLGSFFGLYFCIDIHLPTWWRPTLGAHNPIVRVGVPQVNLGPELFPLGPAPLSREATGPLEFKRGFADTLTVNLGGGQSDGATLVGLDGELEKVVVDADALPGKGSTRYVAELHGPKGSRTLATFDVTPTGGVQRFTPTAPVGHEDLLVVRRLGGEPRPLDV